MEKSFLSESLETFVPNSSQLNSSPKKFSTLIYSSFIWLSSYLYYLFKYPSRSILYTFSSSPSNFYSFSSSLWRPLDSDSIRFPLPLFLVGYFLIYSFANWRARLSSSSLNSNYLVWYLEMTEFFQSVYISGKLIRIAINQLIHYFFIKTSEHVSLYIKFPPFILFYDDGLIRNLRDKILNSARRTYMIDSDQYYFSKYAFINF